MWKCKERATLRLGEFYSEGQRCIGKAILIFEECEAEGYLKKAKEALASLG